MHFLYAILLALSTIVQAQTSASTVVQQKPSVNPAPPQLTQTPKTMADVPAAQQRNFNLSNYFFSRLPQASLPASLLQELEAYYKPLLQFLTPISPDQTVEQRVEEVFDHIKRFYGLLYTTAVFEKGLQLKAANPSSVSTKEPELSLDDIYHSELWQNYLKLSIAESYQNEQNFLTKLFCDNQEIFKYIPAFEIYYYNKNFVSLRTNTEITRIYLMLSENIRQHLCSLCLDWAPLFTDIKQQKKSGARISEPFFNSSLKGLQEIEKFKADDFFINIEKLKNIDLTLTFPIAFNDESGNPISFQQFLDSGCDVSSYFTYAKNTPPTVTSEFELFFTITQDPTTKEYHCYFTGLGNFIFSESSTPTNPGFPHGILDYKTFKLGKGKKSTKAYFRHNAFYNSLFNGEPASPTFGFFCFLTVSSIKYLHSDLTPLFTPEYLDRSLALVEQSRKNSPTFPSCINYQSSDYFFLRRINDIYTDLKITPPASNLGGTPQHGAKQFFDDMGHAFADAADAIASTVEHIAEAAIHAAEDVAEEAYDTAKSAVSALKDVADAVGDGIVSAATSVGDGIADAAEDIGDAVVDTAVAMGDAYVQMGEAIASAAETVGEGIADVSELIGEKVKGFGEAVASAVKKGALDFADDMKKAATSFADAVVHAAFAIKDEAIALYYTSCIFPMLCQGMSFSDALKHAAEYQSMVSQQITSCMNDLTSTVKDLGTAFEDLTGAVTSIVGSAVAMVDTKLGNDLTGMLNSLVDFVVAQFEYAANLIVEVACQTVMLTADAIQMIATVVAMTVTGEIGDASAWESLGAIGENFAEDIVSAILAQLSLAIKFIGQELADAMMCFTFLLAFITEAITVVCAAVEAIGMFIYTFAKTGSLTDATDAAISSYSDAYNAINKYSIIISAVVGIALLVAVTVLTGGASLEFTGPMIAMMILNITMSAFSLAGSVQDNLTAIEKQDRQEHTVNTYRQYVIDNFSVCQGIQGNRGIESLVQYKATKDNTERSLLFYQNSYNQQTSNALSQQAYQVGCYVNNLATPNWNIYNSPVSGATVYPYDTSVSVAGDLGQLYGLTTGRLMLAPSNGFAVYNQGRDLFSQEALVDPVLVSTQTAGSSIDKKDKLETFWFQQKDLTFLPLGTALAGDVVWRVTTQRETPFHIGLYLSERAIDLATLQNFFNNYSQAITGTIPLTYAALQQAWKPFDIYNKFIVDFDNLAKIFVLQRNPVIGNTIDVNNKSKLGVYVVNSLSYKTNWAPTQFPDINFKRGTWYRMKASVQNGNLSVAFWEVGDDTAYEQLMKNPTVTPSPLAHATIPVEQATYSSNLLATAPALKNYSGSMGFVASGAAVEYKVLTPAPTITSTGLRTGQYSNLLSTIYQNSVKPMEKDREIAWQKSLTAALKPSYGTLKLSPIDEMNIATGMFAYYNNSLTPRDIVTFFTQDKNGNYILNANPSSGVQGITSLATGLAYDKNGNIIGFVPNAQATFEKQYSPLSTSLNPEITTLQNNFAKTLQAPITFSNATLTLINVSNPAIFIYQGPSLLIKGGTDFYIAACASGTGITSYGLPFISSNSHNTINAFISITSGSVYYLQTSAQIATPLLPAPSSGFNTLTLATSSSTYSLYSSYQQYFTGPLAQQLATAYQAYKQYEATLTKESLFEAQLTNAINQATSAASLASTQGTLANQSQLSQGQTAITASQAATTAATQLQNLLNQYKQAITANNTTLVNSVYTQAQQQLQVTTQATTAANSAATAAQNAITQNATSFSSFSSSSSSSTSTSTPAASSSFSNFNSSFSSTNSSSSDSDSSDSSDFSM